VSDTNSMQDGALNPQDIRREYTRGELREADMAADPIDQFAHWFTDAQAAKNEDVNAMTLATADPDGQPSARIVLLKEFDQRGFVFFTNYESRKAKDLESNPRAALCIYWPRLERQVRIRGTVGRVSREETAAYFRSRPVAAQVSAWVSRQSSVIISREEMDRREAELLEKYRSEPVPVPDFWGGYRVAPAEIEFWQGRPSRLHDRFLYVKQVEEQWVMQRLSP